MTEIKVSIETVHVHIAGGEVNQDLEQLLRKIITKAFNDAEMHLPHSAETEESEGLVKKKIIEVPCLKCGSPIIGFAGGTFMCVACNKTKDTKPCFRCGGLFYPEDPKDDFCQECGEMIDGASLENIEKINGARAPGAEFVAKHFHPLKGRKASTAASKKCRKCGNDFKQRGNNQKDCDGCRTNIRKINSKGVPTKGPGQAPNAEPLDFARGTGNATGDPMISSNGRKLKVCPECEVKFEPSHKAQKYCSPFCTHEAVKKQKTAYRVAHATKPIKHRIPKPKKVLITEDTHTETLPTSKETSARLLYDPRSLSSKLKYERMTENLHEKV